MSKKKNLVVQLAAIVLATHSSDENFNGDCDYALVRLVPGLVEKVRQRAELARQAAQQDGDLYELSFWSGTAEFYDTGLTEACQTAFAAGNRKEGDKAAREWLAGLEKDGHALLPAGASLDSLEPRRTECDQMSVRCSLLAANPRYEIAWSATPKHSDATVTTSDLPIEALENYAREIKS